MSLDDPESSDETLDFYKSHVRELEAELADFQASSRELEQELEKELEASEKQHRDLRNKNEALRYEVDEWKNKYNKSKTEANSAQNLLQKEITSLREQNRAMQLRLRDMEVSNDDFERQERIVMSSLEDIESKYNHSLERGVMMEEEVRAGEQEREALRIEVQRLRDELSDLKVEQEITAEKLNNTLAMAAKYGNGSLHHVPPPKFPSPLSDSSTILSDELGTSMTTPSVASTATPQSDHSGPPSPPMSEVSTTPSQCARLSIPCHDATTPRPRNFQPKFRKRSRGSSIGGNSALPMPASRSLTQIRGLIGQMQRLEQRVQSARSKLPGPAVTTPPRGSPHHPQMAPPLTMNAITLRSHKKSRAPSVSTASSVTSGGESNYSGRLSYPAVDNRPASRMARPESRAGGGIPRPESRVSGRTSRSSMSGNGLDRTTTLPIRPQSRASFGGRMTPMTGHSFGEYDISGSGRRSMGGQDGGFGMSNRRNTVNSGGSAIPLPRKSYGGRISTVGTREFEEEPLPTTATNPTGHGLVRRLGAQRGGEN
ncbi:NUDE protein [Tricharina praecox]|uniref:NUDE protein n=1 Tax=Tricharina praecox TaxID=43433 RepID=UPI00221EAF61|nr:NUDE protein [Tricharina praecox]KAI5857560.1 NUDE protein [Tricharina praecox]